MADVPTDHFHASFLPLANAAELDAAAPRTPDSLTPTGPSSDTISKWLAATAKLHRASADSPEFFADAARFAVETIGLEAAQVFSLRESDSTDRWQLLASHGREEFITHSQLQDSLNSLLTNPITSFQPSNSQTSQAQSTAAVVAPVLSSAGNVIGAVYGARNPRSENRRRGIRPLEARMMQLLAESVGVGIARLAHETAAARTRVLLEQAFSPTVADYIQQHPECLAGQLREVTMLFADLRGFTTLAETLPPADCYRLLAEVMEVLTQCVLRNQGIVVDYFGDGLLALWNAPLQRADHADRACSAALEMLDTLPTVSQDWQHLNRGPLQLGIGIHTGPVLVGNSGTKSRLKYGPRGNNVHLASRVQGATKQLETPVVITAATRQRLSREFFTLRICTARLPGLEQPVDLFSVYPASSAAEVMRRLDQYAQALACFEQGDLARAESLFTDLVTPYPLTPARFLAQQAATLRHTELGRRSGDNTEHSLGPIIEIREK